MPSASGTSADGEERDGVRQRRRHEADRGADQTEHERRLVAEPLDDGPDEHALHDRAEHSRTPRRSSRSAPRRSRSARAANSANVVWKIANANQ